MLLAPLDDVLTDAARLPFPIPTLTVLACSRPGRGHQKINDRIIVVPLADHRSCNGDLRLMNAGIAAAHEHHGVQARLDIDRGLVARLFPITSKWTIIAALANGRCAISLLAQDDRRFLAQHLA